MTAKSWQFKEKAPYKFRSEHPEFSSVFSDLLWQRELRTKEDIDAFLTPQYERDSSDPFLLKDARSAVNILKKFLLAKEPIVIFGDYDVDGVCGTTILFSLFHALSDEKNDKDSHISIYIPDRSKEGHGLNMAAVNLFIKEGKKLLITVDCGSTNGEEVAYAQAHGMTVIVTDHHQMTGKNSADALINPHQQDCLYPFKDLCGAAVAFKFAQAVLKTACEEKWPGFSLHDGWEKWLLDLVALATVADVMPLLRENRMLVRYGLFVLAHERRPGLKALMRTAGVKPTLLSETLDTNLSPYTIGFILAPRINSAGRIDHANTAFALLNANDKGTAEEFALKLERTNTERQRIIEKIMDEALREEEELKRSPLIFLGKATWPIGVLGIVAGKLAEKYGKPAFLYEIKKEEEKIVGSARSVAGFNIVEALSFAQKYLLKFGGHPQAGGFTALPENADKIAKALFKFAEKHVVPYAAPALYIDSVLLPEALDFKMQKEVAALAPFGEKNPRPIFLMEKARVKSVRLIGKKEAHLLLRLEVGDKKVFKALAFNGARLIALEAGDTVSVAFELEIDEWNGSRELLMKVVDIKKMA